MGHRYESLEVWQKAHQWVLGVYRVTGRFPRFETYGLTSQLRLAHDLGYVDARSLRDLADEISRMLTACAARVRASATNSH